MRRCLILLAVHHVLARVKGIVGTDSWMELMSQLRARQGTLASVRWNIEMQIAATDRGSTGGTYSGIGSSSRGKLKLKVDVIERLTYI